MDKAKSIIRVIGALIPVVYCGGLVYYFFDQSSWSVGTASDIGLGPTMLGLAGVGLLFCIPLFLRIRRMLVGPGSGGGDGSGGLADGETGFDPDAVIARYVASQPRGGATAVPPAPSAPRGGAPAKPSGFGRKRR